MHQRHRLAYFRLTDPVPNMNSYLQILLLVLLKTIVITTTAIVIMHSSFLFHCTYLVLTLDRHWFCFHYFFSILTAVSSPSIAGCGDHVLHPLLELKNCLNSCLTSPWCMPLLSSTLHLAQLTSISSLCSNSGDSCCKSNLNKYISPWVLYKKGKSAEFATLKPIQISHTGMVEKLCGFLILSCLISCSAPLCVTDHHLCPQVCR